MTPTISTIINNPNQVTDGKLKLSIKLVNDTCYQPGSQIPLILTYENLTDDSLIIVDYNLISSQIVIGSHGRLDPILTTTQNVRLHPIEDLTLATLFKSDPPLRQLVLANSKYDFSVKYYLSTKLAVEGQTDKLDSQFQPTSPGQYYFKFVYGADGYEGAWKGVISSNRVELCVVN